MLRRSSGQVLNLEPALRMGFSFAFVYFNLRLCISICVCVFSFAFMYLVLRLCIWFCVCVFGFAFVYLVLRLCIWFCVRVCGFAFVYLVLRLCILFCVCVLHLWTTVGNSINAYISKEDYNTSKTWQRVFLGKKPISVLPSKCPVSVHPLGITRHALKGPLFSTKFLPFALRSAPHIFNQLSEVIQWTTFYTLADFSVVEPPPRSNCTISL